MAKKGLKKKNIRLQRRIRKTMGAVCLITAILVAAIPVPKASAADDSKYLWDEQIGKGKTQIPVIPKNCNTIYTTGDGTYQFAFVNASETSPDKVAVILGYNATNLVNNYLEIPDTVDAFTKFSENQGTRTGYVAVSRSQKPLYFMAEPEKWETDASGNDILISEEVYKPCYYADYASWSMLDLADFYYKNDAGEFIQTTSTTEQWIKNISVTYIGNQSLTANPNAAGADGAQQEWIIAEGTAPTDREINVLPENGVFANESNIKTLIVGDSLMGIGNYAFYGCTALENIQLGNGLTEVGKYAFANCVNMVGIGIDFNSRLQYISDYTFLNCRALTSFTLPASVTTIYDHAFEGCTRLGSEALGGAVDLSGAKEGKNVTLARMGYSVFKGCTSLKELRLPESISSASDVVNLNNFEGCSSLTHIYVESPYTTFADTTTYPVDSFKKDVMNSFYFECSGSSATHEYTKKNAIAFKYSDRDCYEIIKKETAVGGGEAELTYQVNSKNELLNFSQTAEVEEVEIPAAIGPYGISTINSGSFSDNCFLRKITIPATVSRINDNAFKGCHNLQHVVFANAAGITHIGMDAFATQKFEGVHSEKCDNKNFLTTNLSPTLTFTGAVGTGVIPFDYAMDSHTTINAGQQTKSYITYYSGWPTNLEMKYIEDTETGKGAATLVDYPTFTELKTGTKYTAGNYPYITSDYANAAKDALDAYAQWKVDKNTEVTDYQWQIINAALKLSVPNGVKAYKTGLFSGVTGSQNADGSYTVEAVKGETVDKDIQSITFADIDEYSPYSFTGCASLNQISITGGEAKIDDYAFACQESDTYDSALKTFYMTGGGSSVGNYAFHNNAVLDNVTFSSLVSEMGLRPFKDCPILENVSFSGGPYFTASNAIIFGLKNGSKDTIVQCLESRGQLSTPGSISNTELSGVTAIAPEAFMDCEEIGSVDLSSSAVTSIPEKAFYNTKSLYSVSLPTTCKSISKEAFFNSNVRYLDIPGSVTYIDPSAFNTKENPGSLDKPFYTIEFFCEAGSAAETYADQYDNITVTDKPITTTFTVIFWDYDGTVIDTQQVLIGTDAVAPADPVREGYLFTGWLPNFTAISKDTDVVAQYQKIDSEDTKFTVRFIDYDDTVLYTQKVAAGADAILPQAPVREGYKFVGWRPAVTNITKDTDVYAQYEKNTGNDNINGGGNGGNGGNGNVSGGDNNGGNGSTGPLYTLTVQNGSGSGSYAAGATVIIVANEPSSTQQFSKWTTDSTDIKFASTTVAATTMVMPKANVTVTANYVSKPGSGNNNGGNNNGGNNGTDVSGGDKHGNGTIIIIDKNGLSNTGVVTATIKGSSDNFVIRISEDAKATEAIIKALNETYGGIEKLKYFPMDITLWDSTGKKKITDTTGLSITITLPLPDSLITYAGNNKIASVVGESLDILNAKFTTIDGVSCITFTAEHFSPYVIYVDTSRLTESEVIDETPKTGDVHPKWFVVIGLGCMAVVLFVKKDKNGRTVQVQA